jgi:F0F1-type ATP synthase assembly protein I
MSSLPVQLIVGSLLVLGFGAIVVSVVQNYRKHQQPPLSDHASTP